LAGLGAERGFLRGIIEIHGGFLLPVIPGRAQREPGISINNFWIPGSRNPSRLLPTWTIYTAELG
jgi:hypothetical protein